MSASPKQPVSIETGRFADEILQRCVFYLNPYPSRVDDTMRPSLATRKTPSDLHPAAPFLDLPLRLLFAISVVSNSKVSNQTVIFKHSTVSS